MSPARKTTPKASARSRPGQAGRARSTPVASRATIAADVRALVAELERQASRKVRDELGPRYGIHVARAFGVPVNVIQRLAKPHRGRHELTDLLWDTGLYEARLLVAFVGDPERLTGAQMDRWCRGFDNWGVVDTLCFHLFDRSPHALGKVARWAKRRDEFQKRAAFALLACVALHDRSAKDAALLRLLPLVEHAATDERNFVKKGVLWAARGLGGRSPALHAATLTLLRRLAASDDATARWPGRSAARELEKPVVRRRLAARRLDR